MNTEILVLGASGRVGAEVTRSLVAQGIALRAASTRPENLLKRFPKGVETVRFDFHEPATFGAAFMGIKRLFLIRPPQIADVKRLILPTLEAARVSGLRQVVFLSLIGIEDKKSLPHYKIEEYLRGSGLDYTFLRPSYFMQNLESAHLEEIRDRDELYLPVGASATSFVDARDIGEAAALVLREGGHEGRAYELTGPEALDYETVASLFSEILSRPIRYRNPSSLAYILRQLGLRRSPIYALVTAWLYADTKRGMACKVTGEVERLLGRKPTCLRSYIEENRGLWLRA